MADLFTLKKPLITPPLDAGFRPAVLANRMYAQALGGKGVPLVFGIERDNSKVSRFETLVFPEDHPNAGANLPFSERLLKFLLWQRGGFKIFVGGPPSIGDYLQRCYSPDGPRHFDAQFMGVQVYEQLFQITACDPTDVPAACEGGMPLGRHLDGCRIGFDLGASDRKVSALIDGQAVYSEEIIWEPRSHTDPEYHYRHIIAALQSAAAHLPQVDAIGGSSAGIYIDNRPMVASLFRAVPPEQFHKIRNLILRIRAELGVPLDVINDGDVTALAGSMSLEDNGVLGIAMGSSEAAGYVDLNGHILGWLNEMSFAPVD